MASSSIGSVAIYLGNLLLEEAQYLAAVEEKVKELQSELEWMQCFLLDMDKNQCKDALLRKWVFEIKDLAYEVEDLIENHILIVSHENQNIDCLLDPLLWLTSCLRDTKTLHNIGSEIDAVTAKITKMSSRLERYGVKTSYGYHLSNVVMKQKSMIVEQRRTYAHDRDDNIVGLEESVAQLVERLQGGCQEKIVSKFDGFAWAYISQQLQLEPVCRDILLQLVPEDEKKSVRSLQDSELPGELYDKLKQKNYLVILDDVWFKKDWEHLERVFPLSDTSHGSKLLITTRDPQILSGSSLADDLIFYSQLDLLDDKKSWKLLEKTANFQKQDA
ncbi:hypothetical protein RDABS01_001058, partial [Bienertia sinuspersici]